ncbi:tyrosyl-tRNA synthetase [Entomoplasma freundtii]|uniref:Tyrosine--tRNA ligase n=1 Tax=Entomoplasma freundtii TaxID=74700 RepID=A0A2K8NRP9_9MOLU|nr:tyrosine--tRNA ligase [Entomoplasma freundtii]ATZ16444.1 tyrosyl-tRNA synthetase [Entomoplasma freundtii]TDY55974.1 tyrosyl-tRNA synthetase [Entomoplasma freundtii]
MNLIEDLKWRGLLKDISNEEKFLKAQKEHRAAYCGFDPTATSLHVGHLIPMTMLERFRQAGFAPIALLGGGTALIGDPSFKAQERVLLTPETVAHNAEIITKQMKKIIPDVEFMNNYQWLGNLSMVDYLREVGKDFNIAYLLAKEIIATRIQNGLSVTEFLYTTLQADDFYQLYVHQNCFVQIGGSDQWGNITSGLDYIGAKVGKKESQACGLTIPLLTKKDGKKFGKTESGAIWLDSQKTSEYEFYQFWLNQTDEDAFQFLKFFTFLDKKTVDKLEQESQQNPKAKILQKTLAKEMTLFVHGQSGLEKAEKLTNAFFQGTIDQLSPELMHLAFKSLPISSVTSDGNVWDLLLETHAAQSKREANEFLSAKAIRINGETVIDGNQKIQSFPLINDEYLLVKRGKKRYFLAKIKNLN